MSKLIFGAAGNKTYELGVKNGVLYPSANGAYPTGVVWDGLTAVNESPSGAETTKLYADDTVYGTVTSAEEYGGTIEAYQSPEEFDACDGTAEIIPGATIGQQGRKPFGLSFVTTIGNDTAGMEHGYKIHLIWGATASPSEKAHSSINESPEPEPLSWEFTTTPVNVGSGFKPSACMTLDSTTIDADKLTAIKDILYGTDPDTTATPPTEGTTARLPLPSEIIAILRGQQAQG